MYTTILYAGLLLFVLFIAVSCGTQSERQVALVVLAGNLSTVLVITFSGSWEYLQVSIAYLVVDVLAGSALIVLAILRPSWMSILVAAFQLNGTLGHLVKILAPETLNLSYAILLRLWGWPMVLALGAARFSPPLRQVIRVSHLQHLPGPLRPAAAGPLARMTSRKSLDRDLELRGSEYVEDEAVAHSETD